MPAILYKRQRQIKDFLSQFIKKNGYSPTLNEIADAVGLSSLATVHEHLKNLARKGIIKKFEGATRGIEFVDKKLGELTEGVELPIAGIIVAGRPIEPFLENDHYLKVSPSMITGKKRAFVLKVRGDSMIDEGILDGDFVVIEEQHEAVNGDIVVALLENGLATLKRFFREQDRIRLEPANSRMSPIYAVDVQVQGKVVGIIRKYT